MNTIFDQTKSRHPNTIFALNNPHQMEVANLITANMAPQPNHREPEPGMQYFTCTTNDGCELAFQSSQPISAGASLSTNPDPRYRTCILLMHGFSGSSAYFTRNVAALSADHWVVAPDMRGHGRSGRSKGGYHVARLAMDLHELVNHLQKSSPLGTETQIIPVGCSIGAAVLWTYVELFTSAPFTGFIFVDQAPLQDRSWFGEWDAAKAHKGCYDEKTVQQAQQSWMFYSAEAHRGLVESCLGYLVDPPPGGSGLSEEQIGKDRRFFMGISAICDQEWLARLLSDHTRYDHREACEGIRRKTLVMAGDKSGCFTREGLEETVRRVNLGSGKGDLARFSLFRSGHWLFYEEPERFNREVIAFVAECTR
ncbi:Alpha/Beta hydrolase protein [Pseudomassariella vexata]|uniref:Alpha/Beta hydrolase protein n=1 Tax=Pseudomassariella vexata TaxID=1141098 RepID=A0A1Y2DQS0_9PEZI|nr:Alpha/Beta hydrolase protein [Pseudomassariella vexata]ORY61567.1 Alpha/Beta hydrolase protein [Pseudomassariella vexata]